MNQSGKENFDFELKQYFRKKKVGKMLRDLMEKVMVAQPQDLYEFLIEEVRARDCNKTVLLFGKCIDQAQEILRNKHNFVFYDYKEKNNYQDLFSFVNTVKDQAKIILNFPSGIESTLEFQKNPFFYDKIFYIKGDEILEEKVKKIFSIFGKSLMVQDQIYFKEFFDVQLQLIKKKNLKPKICILTRHNNDQTKDYQLASQLMGVQFLNWENFVQHFYQQKSSIGKSKEIQAQNLIKVIKNRLSDGFILNSGFLLNLQIDQSPFLLPFILNLDFDLFCINDQVNNQLNSFVLSENQLMNKLDFLNVKRNELIAQNQKQIEKLIDSYKKGYNIIPLKNQSNKQALISELISKLQLIL